MGLHFPLLAVPAGQAASRSARSERVLRWCRPAWALTSPLPHRCLHCTQPPAAAGRAACTAAMEPRGRLLVLALCAAAALAPSLALRDLKLEPVEVAIGGGTSRRSLRQAVRGGRGRPAV